MTAGRPPHHTAACMLLWAVASCSGPTCSAPENPPAPAPVANPALAATQEASMNIVKTAADLKAMKGQRVTILGLAEDAKSGAVITVEEVPIYVTGLSYWKAPFNGKRVRAEGLLNQRKIAPDPVEDEDGTVSQGMWGEAWMLDEPTYALDTAAP